MTPDCTSAVAASPSPGTSDADDDGRTILPTPRRRQSPLLSCLAKAVQWTAGPDDATPYAITPLLPRVQDAPLRLRDAAIKRLPVLPACTPDTSTTVYRRALLVVWTGLWLMTFVLVYRGSLARGTMGEYGPPVDIGCGASFWVAGNGCGLDGSNCRPFADSGSAFRCPAACAAYQVLNPRAVGDQSVVYQALLVGGPGSGPNANATVYRGDSFVCAAAIHAGIVSDSAGGCGVVRTVGRHAQFAASSRNGMQSIAFPSDFPLAYEFVVEAETEAETKCPAGAHDARWPLLGVSLVFSIGLALTVDDPAAFFWSIFVGLFWHVGIASDPPPHSSVPALLSTLVGRFLPAALAAWVMLEGMGVRRTLTGLRAQLERAVLWLGACWVGALNNYTFAHIPIQRLTPHDLAQQPGAKAALAVIVCLLVVVVGAQVYYFRQEGRLRRYLGLYALLGATLVVFVVLPHLSLRIHHYILALLLLPGTAMQTRPALVYQGVLVGLFVNGIARWGWDAILQTAQALQGDAQLGTALPALLAPAINLANATAASDAGLVSQAGAYLLAAAANASTITFAWQSPPDPDYNGISVLVNDVERFRGFYDDYRATDMAFSWQRPADVQAAALPEYFRFAFMQGSTPGDYTKAGIWTADGSWVPMQPGPSK